MGTTEDKMAEWHHQLDGHEFELALGVGDGQGFLMCYSPGGCRVGHNWGTELNWDYLRAIETNSIMNIIHGSILFL